MSWRYSVYPGTLLHTRPQRHLQVRVDDGLVFADIVLGDDVFEDRLSRRTASLFQTSDGRSDHFGVLWAKI